VSEVQTLTEALGSETVVAWLDAIAADVHAQADRLTQLDAAIGDGDHGINMDRGFQAVARALDGEAEPAPGRALLASPASALRGAVGRRPRQGEHVVVEIARRPAAELAPALAQGGRGDEKGRSRGDRAQRRKAHARLVRGAPSCRPG
jgi:dihydroxyacetone kinase-like protein